MDFFLIAILDRQGSFHLKTFFRLLVTIKDTAPVTQPSL